MKRLFCFLCLSLLLPLLSGASPAWKEPKAPYRILVRQDVPSEFAYLDLRTLAVPADPATGMTVYDSSGKKIVFHAYDSRRILLPKQDRVTDYQIYFGFPTRQASSRFPGKVKVPDDFQLRKHTIAKSYPDKPSQWKSPENKTRMGYFTRLVRERNARYARLRKDLRGSPGLLYQTLSTSMDPAGSRKKLVSVPFQEFLDFLSALEEERKKNLEETMFRNFRDWKSGFAAERIFITIRPFDTDVRFIMIFRGQLVIPRDGTYTFRLNTNSTRILRIDGRTLVRRFGEMQSPSADSIGSREDVSVFLKRGICRFEFLYSKSALTDWAAVLWKKPGEESFRLMAEEDFAPAVPATVLAVENRNGKAYPVVRRSDTLFLCTEKLSGHHLDVFHVQSPQSFRWELDGAEIPSEVRAFALRSLKDPVLTLRPDDPNMLPLTILRHARPGRKISVRPDLSMQFWMPGFLYDDEYGNVELEIASRLPQDLHVSLKTTVSAENPWFRSGTEWIPFPAMPMEYENRFAGGIVRKFSCCVRGENPCLKAGPVTADVQMGLPGLVFSRAGVRISRACDLKEEDLRTTERGLCDADGRKILTILHRTTLHEVRSWELLRKIGEEFSRPAGVFLVAEENAAFRREAQTQFSEAGIRLEMLNWKQTEQPSGSPALNTLPELLRSLKKTTADTVVIIPQQYHRKGILSDREEIGILSLILEKALEKKGVRRVILSSWVPVSPERWNEDPSAGMAFLEELRKLRREKGIAFLELDALGREHAFWKEDSYRSGGIRLELPKDPSELVRLILQEVRRK